MSNFKIQPKAILVGLIYGFAFSILAILLIVVAIKFSIDRLPDLETTVFRLFFTVVGLVGCVAGGYVTYTMSPHSKYANAGIYGIASSLLGVAYIFFMESGGVDFWDVSGTVLTTPAALLGAFISSKKKSSGNEVGDFVGWRKAKRFFSNQDFVWFDLKSVRSEANLSAADIKYIRGWTASPFGFAGILYMPSRKLYDLFTLYIALTVYTQLSPAIAALLSKIPFIGKAPVFLVMVTGFVLFFVSLYLIYLTYWHGRRLSWNRGKWSSVDDLRKSELKWLYFNTFPSLALVAIFIFLMIGAR